MKRWWTAARAVVISLVVLAVAIPLTAYLWLSFIERDSRTLLRISDMASDALGADVTIGSVSIRPFRRAVIEDVAVVLPDSCAFAGDTVALVGRVSAGINLWRLLTRGDLVVDYVLLEDARFRVARDSASSPLNIQPVIDRLKGGGGGGSVNIELAVNALAVRRLDLSYDVLSAPLAPDGRFDANHIAVSNLALNAYIPCIARDSIRAELENLSFRERSGFVLERLTGTATVLPGSIAVGDIELRLPQSLLALEDVRLARDSVGAVSVFPLEIRTARGTSIYPPDASAFVPALARFDFPIGLDMDASVTDSCLEMRRLSATSRLFEASVRGSVHMPDSTGAIAWTLGQLSVNASAELGHALGIALPQATRHINLEASGRSSGTEGNATASLRSEAASGELTARWRGFPGRYPHVSARASFSTADAGEIVHESRLGLVEATAEFDGCPRTRTGNLRANISRLEWNGLTYNNIEASATLPAPERAEVKLSVNDPELTAMAYAFINRGPGLKSVSMTASVANADLRALGLWAPRDSLRLGTRLVAEICGTGWQNVTGYVDMSDIQWVDSHRQGLRIPKISVSADTTPSGQRLRIRSPFLRGEVDGLIDLSSMPAQVMDIAGARLPALIGPRQSAGHDNVFSFNIDLRNTDDVADFFRLPVSVIGNMDIEGHLDSRSGTAELSLKAPYLRNGDKLYENNLVRLEAPGPGSALHLSTATSFQTKKGQMSLSLNTLADADTVGTRLDWTIARAIPLNGTLEVNTVLERLPDRTLATRLDFMPGSVNFGNDTWTIQPSRVSMRGGDIDVRDFRLQSGSQLLALDGKVGKNPDDSIAVAIANLSLLPIFETLEIDKAMIGGRATGTFTGRALLSDKPSLECPDLHVDSIGYNRCTIGDAEILARWENDSKAFYLDADITGDRGGRSRIAGRIFPMTESLDIAFHASDVPVGFLKPFMEAFTSDISGRASGDCRLFGTFKEIDLTGDIWADNVALKVDFTNTVYHTTDSVHMRPGRILIPSATIYDSRGHTARLKGWVNHTYFKAPVFRFEVTDARDFLCYNTTSAQNEDWYGTIYGNGSALVAGEPGVVEIEADMTTTAGSKFTFVLTDRLDAEEYSFIEFRDVTPRGSGEIAIAERDDVAERVQALRDKDRTEEEDEPSEYKMKISVDVTPEADLTLVMDPASGDDIRANGSGHLTMTYDSQANDLRMYGAYALTQGKYHFTLQDIIIKDFTIKEGSTIAFDGDPYAVRSDIRAYYVTNANLSDLDKSFLEDRDIARTNVPVHAVMNVSGDIRQPDITFDLEFPTLTADTYRKVRSIVSTSDMMNRQIIYLLALNRFYTPDYMANTTKGSELFSVASSTISSQLSSLLGKISDHWSIAPNLRSDRGDFSDVEVDVALSSRLLNNRLLFNGNFGYRDKSLNTNQFVGDFDIEYLLDKRGIWRLKAYNRYNDANYYLRQAATTQGVGIMYRRDFDNLFRFLRPKKRTQK